MMYFNSFAANVADRRRHSRLPTSPIGDVDTVPFILLKVPVLRHSVVPKIILILIIQLWDISERILKFKVETLRFYEGFELYTWQYVPYG